MSIELHCPQCAKLIRAPDNSGGRKGKCPYCKRTVYIPTAVEDDDVIAIAPVDPSEQAREDQLRRESTRYAASIDHAGAVEPERGGSLSGRARESSAHKDRPIAADRVVDVERETLAFISAMKNSKLDEAERIVVKLGLAGIKGKEHARSLLRDGAAPAVEDLPPAVVQGFLKSLVARLD